MVRNQTERIQGGAGGAGRRRPGGIGIPTKRLDRGLGCGMSAVVGGREQRSVVLRRHVIEIEQGRQSKRKNWHA